MTTQAQILKIGLDVGSTTAKIIVINENHKILFSDYQRHNTRIHETIEGFINKAIEDIGDCEAVFQLTGSAGMGVSEKTGTPFIQEVIATDAVIKKLYPDVKTLIDIGGEDSKMIFFHDHKIPDIRMNGNCAGGTGAFIDQIASLLNVTTLDLNELAKKHTTIHPIASRCGVFAKTDVQNLISRKVPKEDIAASIFHAVAIQCMNTLARGFDINPKLMLCGGPFTFLSELSKIFLKAVNLNRDDLLIPKTPELLPALGAALSEPAILLPVTPRKFIELLKNTQNNFSLNKSRLDPLFQNEQAYSVWKEKNSYTEIEKKSLKDYAGRICFLGIDSGSTTTKITVSGENDELLFSWYKGNLGNPIDTVITGLELLRENIETENSKLQIARATVTGYGEDLIKSAFGMDKGVVETIAHYTAAKHVSPDVSFILDIGGQDMKAIFVEDGVINRIELNEACSSGCGSFIETFGNSLDYKVADFAEIACKAKDPCDLGTRCTVFMNSKVKQSLRENATVDEISAGLAYSVIKNCLFKVLKLTDMSELGDHVVLQGGTFKNPSIIRAMEILSGKEVKCSNIPELMGAYGAALISRQDYINNTNSSFVGLADLESVNNYKTKLVSCKGCENNCVITRFTFDNRNSFFSGNKCEKFFNSKGEKVEHGFNFYEYKLNQLFNQSFSSVEKPIFTMGIPRCLSIYENFPFWNTLFTSCGIEVKLSAKSNMKLYEKGLGGIMSDSICFPAKLAHGHIIDLAEQGVDRIFYPMVMHEKTEFEDSVNSFTCPIGTRYGEDINSAINPEKKLGIPFDKPVVTFKDTSLLKKSCVKYLKQFGIPRATINQAVLKARAAQRNFKATLRKKGEELIENAVKSNRLLVVLAGRPYQCDPLINQKSPEVLASLGVDVITEDAIPFSRNDTFDDIQVLTQWSYPNRIYKCTDWVSRQPNNIQLVQFNSFGCGPDALVTDEARDLLKTGGKNYTLIKIDEITSTGSVRLRLRSMLESLKLKKTKNKERTKRVNTPIFEIKDQNRTIIAPHFADSYSPLIPALFEISGYNLEILPEPDKESVELGLKYSNNDICFPATIIIGDIIKALQTGGYDHNKIAVGITQTGGQCRASSYLALIRKAMISAGFDNIPVVSCTLTEGLNDQPGFKVDWLKLTKIMYLGAIAADSLAKMYYATVVREKRKGESKNLHKKYLKLADKIIRRKDYKGIFELLKSAVKEFNGIEVNLGNYPKIGIVGEIYVKYNSFGHQRIVDWLIEQGIEVVVPPILDFFTQNFVNLDENRRFNLRKPRMSDLFVKSLELYTNQFKKKTNKIISQFRYATTFHNIRDISKQARLILELTNQFGEGWLIPAEIASFANEGVNNVVSLQPFGCIANHIISKGVETKIRDLYPDMNILFLDFEAGTSEVNILNRLYFMMKNVSKSRVVA